MLLKCMYVCFSIIQFLSFLSGTKADGLANETDVQMDAVADGLATCTWTLEALMKLDTEADRLAYVAE